MSFAVVRDYCISRPAATEELPFGPDALVFKVGGKIFAIIGMERLPTEISLKCDPERAVELRERYEGVRPGYHLNKRHWNTITVDGTIPRGELLALIDHSYELVLAGLPKKVRAAIREQYDFDTASRRGRS